MNIGDLILLANNEPSVKNGLLGSGQVAYNLGLNTKIGEQKKIIYNAMGPDISTALYLANPEEIFGIEKENFIVDKFLDLLENNFDNIENDVNILDNINPYQIIPSREVKKYYRDGIKTRRDWGYWDYNVIDKWGRERLMLSELKLMGLEKEDINVKKKKKKLILEFDWKHPFSDIKQRRIEYNYSSTMESIKVPRVNCFYQKSLENFDKIIFYSELSKKKIKDSGSAFFGYWHTNTESRNNLLLKSELGKNFSREIKDEEFVNLIEELRIIGYYGTRLHGFRL